MTLFQNNEADEVSHYFSVPLLFFEEVPHCKDM